MQIISINLISKNNKTNGFYLYLPIIENNGLFYFCESISSDKPLKKENIQANDIKIKREIPKEYYKVNGIN